MDHRRWDTFDTVALVMCVLGIVGWAVIWYGIGKDDGYRQGQIDALTGKVKYELVVQPDSTRTWEKKKTQREE